MQMRFVAVLAVVIASIGLIASKAPVSAAGNCLGHQATVVPDGHTYVLTAGDDVVVGTSQADEVTTFGGGTGGTDYICTGNGDDSIYADGVVSVTIRTGNGNDFVNVQNFSETGWMDVALGNGNDFAERTFNLGGSLRGDGGSDTLFFQGFDIIPGASVDGGSGNDYIQSAAADFVDGGSGTDTVIDQSDTGASLVDCGSGHDTFYAPNAAAVRRCETPL